MTVTSVGDAVMGPLLNIYATLLMRRSHLVFRITQDM